jgi:hypothetical protein
LNPGFVAPESSFLRQDAMIKQNINRKVAVLIH